MGIACLHGCHSEILKRVRDEARRRGVRWTTQRQSIVETFIACADHVTVEDLHHRVRLIDPDRQRRHRLPHHQHAGGDGGRHQGAFR
jgi:Fe2+ or Zn2+ uptake regulation protein